jgi:chemotaxis-related protein WspB
MLFLTFKIRTDRYTIGTADVVELLPMVRMKSIVKPPPGVIGLFNYHGTAVPVVDLTLLATGMQAPSKMTTRLAVVKYRGSATAPDPNHNLLGLVAEQLTETITAQESDFTPAGVTSPSAPYVGAVLTTPDGVIQRLDLQKLFPPELHESLFSHTVDEIPQCTR